MPEDALRLEQVGIRLGGRRILDGVEARIAPGEFVGVFGPNGAGKSTLTRAILGLFPLAQGSIAVFGRSPRAATGEIGFMPQRRADFGGLTLSGRAMVKAVESGRRWGIPWTSRTGHKEVERVLEEAGAIAFADRPYSVLSGGERQRIALAQCLVGRPRLLLLDEPLASLDPKSQSQLIETVGRICGESGVTVLFIAHDLNPLLQRMDRTWYLANGRARIGTPEEVISTESLSRLYGAPMEVIRFGNRLFILSPEHSVTETARHG